MLCGIKSSGDLNRRNDEIQPQGDQQTRSLIGSAMFMAVRTPGFLHRLHRKRTGPQTGSCFLNIFFHSAKFECD